jgi:hypothetical protein
VSFSNAQDNLHLSVRFINCSSECVKIGVGEILNLLRVINWTRYQNSAESRPHCGEHHKHYNLFPEWKLVTNRCL